MWARSTPACLVSEGTVPALPEPIRTAAVAAGPALVQGLVALDGLPCTPVSSMLTAPNDTIDSPVNRPIAGLKANRALMKLLLPPSLGVGGRCASLSQP